MNGRFPQVEKVRFGDEITGYDLRIEGAFHLVRKNWSVPQWPATNQSNQIVIHRSGKKRWKTVFFWGFFLGITENMIKALFLWKAILCQTTKQFTESVSDLQIVIFFSKAGILCQPSQPSSYIFLLVMLVFFGSSNQEPFRCAPVLRPAFWKCEECFPIPSFRGKIFENRTMLRGSGVPFHPLSFRIQGSTVTTKSGQCQVFTLKWMGIPDTFLSDRVFLLPATQLILNVVLERATTDAFPASENHGNVYPSIDMAISA